MPGKDFSRRHHVRRPMTGETCVPDCTAAKVRIAHSRREITLQKEHNMHQHRFLSSLIVAAALLAPGLGLGVAAADERTTVKAGPVTLRVYDRSHKDYHVWDDQEDQRYRKYLSDNRQKYHPIQKLSNKRQTTYWNSRHADDRR
jgi:hypothetical protein